MENSAALSHLKVILNSPHHQNYRHIMGGEESLRYIENVGEFYYALGYTDEMAKQRIVPDQFI